MGLQRLLGLRRGGHPNNQHGGGQRGFCFRPLHGCDPGGTKVPRDLQQGNIGMIPFPSMMMLGAGKPPFPSYEQELTGSLNTWLIVPVPLGATAAKLELIGPGGGGSVDFEQTQTFGGSGGAYARTDAVGLAGITALAVYIPAGGPGTFANYVTAQDAVIRLTSSAGEIVCMAKGGRAGPVFSNAGGGAAQCVGDFSVSGQGSSGITSGSAAGPNGLGVAPAGAGKSSNSAGNLYGGGGVGGSQPGAQAWGRITWS